MLFSKEEMAVAIMRAAQEKASLDDVFPSIKLLDLAQILGGNYPSKLNQIRAEAKQTAVRELEEMIDLQSEKTDYDKGIKQGLKLALSILN